MPLRSALPFHSDLAPENDSSPLERRKRARLQVHWRLLIRQDASSVVETVTHDLSTDGFYCLSVTPFVPGEIRDCTLRVPTHDPENVSRTLQLHCRVRVVRVETLAETGLYGVGCRIENYRFPDFAPDAGSLVARCETRLEAATRPQNR